MKRIEFTPPPAVKNTVGDGLKAGQRLELMAEFQVKEGGDWCLVAIEDVALPGYEDKPPGNFVEAYKANAPA